MGKLQFNPQRTRLESYSLRARADGGTDAETSALSLFWLSSAPPEPRR